MNLILKGLVLAILLGCAPATPGIVGPSAPFDPSGKYILIQSFDLPPAMTNVNRAAAAKLGDVLAFYIQLHLKNAGLQRVLVVKRGDRIEGDLLIRGTLTRVEGGSQFHRISMELFGSGASEVEAMGEIVDLKTSTPLTGFAFRQTGLTWLANESAVRENLRKIAEEIARVLIQMQN